MVGCIGITVHWYQDFVSTFATPVTTDNDGLTTVKMYGQGKWFQVMLFQLQAGSLSWHSTGIQPLSDIVTKVLSLQMPLLIFCVSFVEGSCRRKGMAALDDQLVNFTYPIVAGIVCQALFIPSQLVQISSQLGQSV